jgi:predicted acetyltransferase
VITNGCLQLRSVVPADEAEFRAADEAMKADQFSFGLGLESAGSWQEYLQHLEDYRLGRNLPPDRVPGSFLLADVGGVIVGRASIRHRLTVDDDNTGSITVIERCGGRLEPAADDSPPAPGLRRYWIDLPALVS